MKEKMSLKIGVSKASFFHFLILILLVYAQNRSKNVEVFGAQFRFATYSFASGDYTLYHGVLLVFIVISAIYLALSFFTGVIGNLAKVGVQLAIMVFFLSSRIQLELSGEGAEILVAVHLGWIAVATCAVGLVHYAFETLIEWHSVGVQF